MYPKMVILLVFMICAFDLCSVSARSNGAPSMACQSLSPWHITWTGFVQSEQPKSSPFAVEAVIQPGNKRISVNIHPQKMKMNQTFRGFVVQARLVDKPEVIVDGIFVTDEGDDTQSFVCGRGHKQKNTWTHSSAEDKSSVNSTWIAPMGFTRSVIFQATIVQTRTIFWENQFSQPIRQLNKSK